MKIAAAVSILLVLAACQPGDPELPRIGIGLSPEALPGLEPDSRLTDNPGGSSDMAIDEEDTW